MTQSNHVDANRAHGAMLLYSAMIATSFPVGAAITGDLDPVVLTQLRFTAAAVALAAVLALRRELDLPRPGDLLRYAAISVFIAIFFIAMFEALRWTDPLSTGALFTLVPLMTLAFGYALNRQRSTVAQILCLLVGGAGAVWVLFRGDLVRLLGFELGKGEAIFAVGCVAFACYAPVIAKLHRGEPASRIALWSIVAGAVLLLLYALPRFGEIDLAALPTRVWLGIFYLAAFNTAGTFLLIKYASVRLPTHKVMAYTYLTPAFVALLEGLLGNGWPSASVLAGILVTAGAMVLLLRV